MYSQLEGFMMERVYLRVKSPWLLAAMLAIGMKVAWHMPLIAADFAPTTGEIATDGWPSARPWHHYPYRYYYAYPEGRPLNYNNYFSYPYNSYYYHYYVYPNTSY